MLKKSCHKCAGSLEKAHPSTVAHCPACGTGYHITDCGMRYLAKGLDVSSVSQCPKCYKMCECSGGIIPCHTANVRLRGAAKKRGQAYLRNNRSGTSRVEGFEEPEAKVFDTFLVSTNRKRPCIRPKQQPKVPIVVGQLIRANQTLQDEVKRLQEVISRCTCDLGHDAGACVSPDHEFAPQTPPDASDCEDVDAHCMPCKEEASMEILCFPEDMELPTPNLPRYPSLPPNLCL